MKAAALVEAPRRDRDSALGRAASRPRMTRRLAERRAVGDPAKPKFDGVALLRLLKK